MRTEEEEQKYRTTLKVMKTSGSECTRIEAVGMVKRRNSHDSTISDVKS